MMILWYMWDDHEMITTFSKDDCKFSSDECKIIMRLSVRGLL